MDSMAQATLEIEAGVRASAVIDLIEKTLGIKIGPTEITEAALGMRAEEKIKLAATLWESAMPPMTEPTAGVYVLTAREHAWVLEGLQSSWDHGYDDNDREKMDGVDALKHRLINGDQF